MPPAKNTPDKSQEPKKAAEATPASSATPSDDKTVTPAQPAVPAQPAPNHDDTDVAAALKRKTQDGKGGEPPESNFDSFATEGVEREKSDLDIAHEVLEGKWGFSRTAAFAKLREAGLDTYAIDEEVKRLQDAGKPSTLSD